MTPERFQAITARYPALKIAIVGDFCLDRYLEIDPARAETSLETGLPVHNVTRVRAQPGAAGTILSNVAALGAGEIFPVGFCGEDGEGFELRRALGALPGVQLDHFLTTPLRRTFTYCKPLVVEPGRPPRELSRLDSKNWTPTPPPVAAPVGGVAADSLGANQVGALMFPIAQAHVAQAVLVSDAAIVEAQRLLWDRLRLVAEPGGATALAALLSGAFVPPEHARVGVIVCGANTDPAKVAS